MKPLYIGIDFDGTVVTHAYPRIGRDLHMCVPTLRELVGAGHKLILFTMRSNETLAEAVEWFTKYELPLFGINTNPTQSEWTQSPKAYCHIYIDDAALGCPLTYDEVSGRPFADWAGIRALLQARKVLP